MSSDISTNNNNNNKAQEGYGGSSSVAMGSHSPSPIRDEDSSSKTNVSNAATSVKDSKLNAKQIVSAGVKNRVNEADNHRIHAREKELTEQRKQNSINGTDTPWFQFTHDISTQLLSGEDSKVGGAARKVASNMHEIIKKKKLVSKLSDGNKENILSVVCENLPEAIDTAGIHDVSLVIPVNFTQEQHDRLQELNKNAQPEDRMKFSYILYSESTEYSHIGINLSLKGFKNNRQRISFKYNTDIGTIDVNVKVNKQISSSTTIVFNKTMLKVIHGWTAEEIQFAIDKTGEILGMNEEDASAVFAVITSFCQASLSINNEVAIGIIKGVLKETGKAISIVSYFALFDVFVYLYKTGGCILFKNLTQQVIDILNDYQWKYTYDENEDTVGKPTDDNLDCCRKDRNSCYFDQIVISAGGKTSSSSDTTVTTDGNNSPVTALSADDASGVNNSSAAALSTAGGSGINNSSAASLFTAGGDSRDNSPGATLSAGGPGDNDPATTGAGENEDAAKRAPSYADAARRKKKKEAMPTGHTFPQHVTKILKNLGAFNYATASCTQVSTTFVTMAKEMEVINNMSQQQDQKVDTDNGEKKDEAKEPLGVIVLELWEPCSSAVALFMNESTTLRALARASVHVVAYSDLDMKLRKVRNYAAFVGPRFGEVKGRLRGGTEETTTIQPLARQQLVTAAAIRKVFSKSIFSKPADYSENGIPIVLAGSPKKINKICKKHGINYAIGNDKIDNQQMSKRMIVTEELYQKLLNDMDGYVVQDRRCMTFDEKNNELHRATMKFKREFSLSNIFDLAAGLYKKHGITSSIKNGTLRLFFSKKDLDYKKILALRAMDGVASVFADFPPARTFENSLAAIQAANKIADKKMELSQENLKKQQEDGVAKTKKKLTDNESKLDTTARVVFALDSLITEERWKKLAEKYGATAEIDNKNLLEKVTFRWKDNETAANHGEKFLFFIDETEECPTAMAGHIPNKKRNNDVSQQEQH